MATEKRSLGKRPREEEEEDNDQFYKFKLLLPNGTTVVLNLRTSESEMPVNQFISLIRDEYDRTVGSKIVKERRKVLWRSPELCIEDLSSGIKMTKIISFACFRPDKYHYLKIHDGVKDAPHTFENMWDLTPDTDMLMELPQEYAFETALADLIDNSLQAVWSIGHNERKLVSVTINENGISIFDTGPGMDGHGENSIAKWGTMGASLHRSSKRLAIGGRPPYLTPFFGMFGSGGAIASMHLGRHALVSSKTKDSKKVYTLHLEREALLKSGEKSWKTDGGIRNPLEDEISLSPHGSFTKVEISNLKVRVLNAEQLKCKLKDIYFPYIQCDEMLRTGKTSTPIRFQVNGEDLADLDGGEVAITNMLSCNGPDFVLQLQFLANKDSAPVRSAGSGASLEAHARLKCVYFPIVEGKESIDRILERLNEEGFQSAETFDTFCRVSIRRLGRLLPDARWGRLPFMQPRQRKGDRAQVLKRCCMRVKCFIDTDAGFNPNPSKTDLAHHHLCTTALKNFGCKPPEKESDVNVEILRDGKLLSLSQLEKEYEAWVFHMHDRYDEEIVSGEDEAVVVFVSAQNRKGLGITSQVVRVHRVIKRKGEQWESGQHIKILKGAVGCHKNNLHATLEYILLEGLEGEACGEARLICRPLHVPSEKGCLLKVDDMDTSLDIRGSMSFPISVIDSGKCKLLEASELERQLEKLRMKAPSKIDILNAHECRQLEIDEAIDFDAPIHAEDVNLKKITAVLRPVCYDSHSSRTLDQKVIVKDDLEMSMEITYGGENGGQHEWKHTYAERVKSSHRNGIQGLYIFSFGSRSMKLFQKSGIYKFCFSVNYEDLSNIKCEKRLTVLPNTQLGQWKVLRDEKSPTCHVRVGSCLPCISIAYLNAYGDRLPFVSTPEVIVKVESSKGMICHVRRMKVDLSSSKMVLNISDLSIESSNLVSIRPHYNAMLAVSSRDDVYHVRVPFKVFPGPYCQVRVVSIETEKHLLPGSVFRKLVLEILDRFGNHVERGVEVSFDVDGLYFQDHKGMSREVNDKGCIDLSGLLKVNAGYGKLVSFSVNNGEEKYFKKEFQVEQRWLKIVSAVPEYCPVGSQLEGLKFEIVDSEGAVDETLHHMKYGKSHTLKIKFLGLDDSLQHILIRGRCTVPSIPIPQEEGIHTMFACHSDHPELCTNIQVRVAGPRNSQVESLFEVEDVLPSQSSGNGMLLLQGPPGYLSKGDQALVESIVNGSQELENAVSKAASTIGDHEKKLKLLSEKKKALEQGICGLQEMIEPQELCLLDWIMNEQEVIMRRIEGKYNTAAAVICKMLKLKSQGLKNQWVEDVIGIVALLGNCTRNDLGRIFAEYLGEDNMLAIVCKSRATANTLENYGEHGKVDNIHALHALAGKLGVSINGRFHVICLDEISPWTGRIDSGDPQRKLVLPNPLLPTGKTPLGFLGYAVNMINIDFHNLYTRTRKGHGLRETLFYLLFGKLQVYETRECMRNAASSIKHGAVSLDGGIVRGNGVISLGAREPEVCFPVESLEFQRKLSRRTASILRDMAFKKLELESTSDEIDKECKEHFEALLEFQRKKEIFMDFMNTHQPTVEGIYSVNSQAVNVKTESAELDSSHLSEL